VITTRFVFWVRLLGVGLLLLTDAAAVQGAEVSFEKDIRPLLQQFCFDCHDSDAKKGDLALDGFKGAADVRAHTKIWDGVMFQIDNWMMPPEKKRQPTPEQRKLIVSWIDNTLYPVDPTKPDPGRVTIHRLNKAEYNNTIRDLLRIELKPAESFPDDDSGYGFDSIADVLAMPPVLVERYLMAADQVLDAAIVTAGAQPQKTDLKPGSFEITQAVGRSLGHSVLFLSNEEAKSGYDFPAEAEYIFRVMAHAEQGGNEPAQLKLAVSGQEQIFSVKGTESLPQKLEARFRIKKGWQPLVVGFINDFTDGKSDRNLYVDNLQIIGPIWSKDIQAPESHRRIFIHDAGTEGTEAGMRKVLSTFASRAYRRPATAEEVEKLVRLAVSGQKATRSWEAGIKLALKAVLVSPFFLYRIEWQPEPNNPEKIVDLSEFALASRLSYFLWSSMPDDTLFQLAAKNQLRANLPAQVKRMLTDWRGRALAENFGGQWLETRNLQVVTPSRKYFPLWNEGLAYDLAQETAQVFEFIQRENRSVLEFLTADYTFLNKKLAKFYQVSGSFGEKFEKVALDTSRRRGVLTHASVLTVTSDPNRTSPVKRGKWVLENILGTPPPPPPPNVPTLESSHQLSGTLRQRMEQHRSNTMCASCHSLLDPIGFGLENFDGIGLWRDLDGASPVESVGRLTTGQSFKDAQELTDILVRDKKDLFLKCLSQKLLTYALGRGTEPYDKLAIAEIAARTEREGYGFQNLVQAVVESVPFQKRRGGGR
jgi:Protein of unknown function (DUF1592)/Protein of unknown function (DUF1588)/Protein of unknown function (DUF1587)/Protein of unknown function (DUF1585)/Protein of unknown function (DUF1595)/Ca-dependent carbohydrate-binding module xylan-binding/Planctomycete cytochrome C